MGGSTSVMEGYQVITRGSGGASRSSLPALLHFLFGHQSLLQTFQRAHKGSPKSCFLSEWQVTGVEVQGHDGTPANTWGYKETKLGVVYMKYTFLCSVYYQ